MIIFPSKCDHRVARGLLVLAVLVTSSCSSSEWHPPRTTGAAIEADLKENSDEAIVSAHPRLMRREGATLIVGEERFTDEGDCQWGDCTRYRADGVWNDEYVGIRVTHYESGDYLLVGGRQSWSIRSRPITSPNGRRFFTGFHADNEEWTPSDGASVWDWRDYPRRLRVVDAHLVVFDQFTRWHGDSCIEFTGARGGYGGGDMEPQRTFWLVEQNRDWQLLEERPATCH